LVEEGVLGLGQHEILPIEHKEAPAVWIPDEFASNELFLDWNGTA